MAPDTAAAGGERDRLLKLPPEPRLDPGSGAGATGWARTASAKPDKSDFFTRSKAGTHPWLPMPLRPGRRPQPEAQRERVGFRAGRRGLMTKHDSAPWKGALSQRVRTPPGKCRSGRKQSERVMEATTWPEALRSRRAALGGSATMRAATRVNAEQAPKRTLRKPTQLSCGEGCHRPGSERREHRWVPPG